MSTQEKKEASIQLIAEHFRLGSNSYNKTLHLTEVFILLDYLLNLNSLTPPRRVTLRQVQDSIAGRLIEDLEATFGSRYTYLTSTAEDIIATCENKWEANKSDCNAFVKAVAGEYGVSLTGVADDIVDTILGDGWEHLGNDGVAAKAAADDNKLVIGGLKGADHNPPRAHGHVVIVVKGDLAKGKYPTGYWGSIGGVGKKNTTINYAWNASDRDNVVYSAKVV